MATSISKLTVYNLALAELEQEPVVSLSTDSRNLKVLNNAYDLALYTALKARNWDFATTFVQLNLISDASNLSPYTHLYALPNDFIEFQRVFDTDGNDVEFINTADGLYTNADPCYIQYTKLITDYSKFDEDFIKLLAYSLAELCAAEIQGDTQKEDFLSKKVDKIEAIAASKSVGKARGRYNITSNSDYINGR